MKDNNIENLILKFISKSIDAEELTILSLWLVEDEENKRLFKDYIRINYAIEYNMAEFNVEKAKLNAINSIETNSSKKSRKIRSIPYVKYAAAAAILFIISFTFFYKKEQTIDLLETKVVDVILPGTDKAILTLGDGEQVALEKGNTFKRQGVHSDGENIFYENDTNESTNKIVYNYLEVPRGGQFNVELSDGTKVWLNSESKIKYPSSFVNDKIREVELVYGEAYFDVSSSKDNNGTVFNVKTKHQDVVVLGTEFNIASYEENEEVYTTLIEGKVKVNSNSYNEFLIPGEQSVTSVLDERIKKRKVDVNYVVAWKNGFFMFDKKPLVDIMKQLSRWYNIEVRFEDENKKHLEFSGMLKRTNSINELLIKIERTGLVKFTANEKKIIIN